MRGRRATPSRGADLSCRGWESMTTDASFDLIIAGGTVVTDETTQRADVGIAGGRIQEVGDLSGRKSRRRLDAQGCLVLPGLVDPHTHMSGSAKSLGSLANGLRVTSEAALIGGTTTILDFISAAPDVMAEEVERTVSSYSGHMATDFGAHASLHEPLESADQLARAKDVGVTSFHFSLVGGRGRKVATDGELLRGFELIRDMGGMVIVHAENESLNNAAVERFTALGEIGLELAGDCHPWYSEGEGARRAVFLAEVAGASMYVEHLSTEPALEGVRLARARGRHVYAETCPHYLNFNKDIYATPRGAEFLKSPPLRRAEDQDALWQGILEGIVVSIGTDESTAQLTNKQKLLEERPVHEVSGGLNQIEVRLPVMYSELVVRRGAPVTRLVALLSANPARLFGLYPRKGSLQPGADADVVVVDPSEERTIRNADLHQGTDHTIFEGWVTRGWPRAVVAAGEVVVQDGQLNGHPSGRYLPCDLPMTEGPGLSLSLAAAPALVS
jgi:dihydropyrimidinase